MWLYIISSRLRIHNPIHLVVVPCIPAMFIPTNPHHIDMLLEMNPETLAPEPVLLSGSAPLPSTKEYLNCLYELALLTENQLRGPSNQIFSTTCTIRRLSLATDPCPVAWIVSNTGTPPHTAKWIWCTLIVRTLTQLNHVRWKVWWHLISQTVSTRRKRPTNLLTSSCCSWQHPKTYDTPLFTQHAPLDWLKR